MFKIFEHDEDDNNKIQPLQYMVQLFTLQKRFKGFTIIFVVFSIYSHPYMFSMFVSFVYSVMDHTTILIAYLSEQVIAD